jgi:hypothetical protein
MVCANPMCGSRLGLHAHHIQFRANGGKTALHNEVAVCDRCHALIHAGLLVLEGNPLVGLSWKPKCGENEFAFNEELARTSVIAQVYVAPTYESGTAQKPECATVDSERETLDAALIRALKQIGYAGADAIDMMAAARKAVTAQGIEPNEQNLFLAALRAA